MHLDVSITAFPLTTDTAFVGQLSDNGKGIVTVMHDLPLAFDFSDRLTVMNNGGIIACGTPSELCNLPIIEDIFGVKIKQMQDDKYSYQYG